MIKFRGTDTGAPVEPLLDERVRRTLHAVAATVTEPAPAGAAFEPAPDAYPPARAGRTGGRRAVKRPLRLAAVLLAIALPVTAGAYLLGSEYVDQIPPRNAMVADDAHGERYWMIPGRVRDDCGQRASAVELVIEEDNSVGQEWNTMGIQYGDPIVEWVGTPEPVPSDPGALQGMSLRCGTDESAWLADPTRIVRSWQPLGSDRVFLIGTHPRATAIRVAASDGTALTVPTMPLPDRPTGPRYAALDVPAAATAVVVTLLDERGEPIPGSEQDLLERRVKPRKGAS
jgi:hypothetical protein